MTTPYLETKRLLVQLWPKGRVVYAVATVMKYFKISCSIDGLVSIKDAILFMQSIKMPSNINIDISAYLAMHYPKTSRALYDGKSKEHAEKILLTEKKVMKKSSLSRIENLERASIRNEKRTTKVISARGLDKRADWGTVK